MKSTSVWVWCCDRGLPGERRGCWTHGKNFTLRLLVSYSFPGRGSRKSRGGGGLLTAGGWLSGKKCPIKESGGEGERGSVSYRTYPEKMCVCVCWKSFSRKRQSLVGLSTETDSSWVALCYEKLTISAQEVTPSCWTQPEIKRNVEERLCSELNIRVNRWETAAVLSWADHQGAAVRQSMLLHNRCMFLYGSHHYYYITFLLYSSSSCLFLYRGFVCHNWFMFH